MDYVPDSGHWKQGDGYLLRFPCNGAGEIMGGPFGYANGLAFDGEGNLYVHHGGAELDRGGEAII